MPGFRFYAPSFVATKKRMQPHARSLSLTRSGKLQGANLSIAGRSVQLPSVRCLLDRSAQASRFRQRSTFGIARRMQHHAAASRTRSRFPTWSMLRTGGRTCAGDRPLGRAAPGVAETILTSRCLAHWPLEPRRSHFVVSVRFGSRSFASVCTGLELPSTINVQHCAANAAPCGRASRSTATPLRTRPGRGCRGAARRQKLNVDAISDPI
jgi:hypothetical protein